MIKELRDLNDLTMQRFRAEMVRAVYESEGTSQAS